ncbi:signal transduction histidine kinase [Haloactinopolyspora alba]|uniref:histidine kinase n=1 Tax=Haloactinopolyspora alba TaxID=648780 RepID=A0A2P8EFY6_9ACTN|nr:sensor histidine kinase [Haloactinopolyspora alba]PSL08385.1 signal transduction histidine kinase [Haloactinopolyspora alba]
MDGHDAGPVWYSRWFVATLTAVLTVVFALSAWWSGDLDGAAPITATALILANTVPLLALRWNPLVVTLAFGVVYPLWLAGGGDMGRDGHVLQSLPTLVALFMVGAWARPLWLRAVALAVPAWMMGAVFAGLWDTDALDLSYVALVFVVVWALGVVIAERRAYATELEATTAELRAAQHQLADRAVADERARIARELHDVIAHAMSVITVQAGVGAHLIESRPAKAGESLSAIERTGREALSEMRRMLTVLRDPDPAGPRPGPQPGLDDVAGLVAAAADAGVVVTVETDGAPRPLPPGLDLAAYRVVQEALTNVVKHAGGARAQLTIGYRADELVIRIKDQGRARRESPVPGQGLRGMAERVALYDGTLETAPEPDGFLVRARFPLETAEPGAAS